MLKWLGAVLLILSGLGGAVWISSREKRRMEKLMALLAWVKYVQNQIDCYSAPMQEILSGTPPDMWKALDFDEPPPCLSEVTDKVRRICGDAAGEILASYEKAQGRSYRETEVRLCQRTASALEALLQQKQRAFPAHQKTTVALCLAAVGIAVIILL